MFCVCLKAEVIMKLVGLFSYILRVCSDFFENVFFFLPITILTFVIASLF